MGRLEQALALAGQGFFVFPCAPGAKTPAVNDWPNRATRDAEQIEKWWASRDYNIGISTSRFGDDQALVVVDVDNKGDKHGDTTLLELELQGFEFPVSVEQSTPSGGRHVIYTTEQPLKQGVDVLGVGLDIRSKGGYIVGPGSEIGGRRYAQINGHGILTAAPAWLVDRLGVPAIVDRNPIVLPGNVDADRARDRALAYLKAAPLAVEGNAGDQTTFVVAAKLKDFGCTPAQALELLLDYWNERCSPPWDGDELEEKVNHAYRYGKEPAGIAAPEAVFNAVEPAGAEDRDGLHPLDKLNEEYIYVKRGAFILQETTDEDDRFTTNHLSQDEMHGWFANKTMQVGDKPVPMSRLWVKSPSRREVEAVVFKPGVDVGARFYNLWRGFTVEPAANGNHPAVDAFKEHALKNVCNGDEKLCRWLLGYFAHMIQKPNEKPLTALVFKGKKGTGKNALVERVGALLGDHALVADDERYLMSNFNAHFESNLFLILDEAAWAGDKRAEGRLKGLITGSHHNIERKGREMYRVKNLSRVAILGNENWLVPATADERRFAVFNVGDGRKQDRAFFHDMRVGMERGGYAHLLRFLLDFNISDIDVNDAPATQGLLEQKLATLEPAQKWWHDCLAEGSIVCSEFGETWPEAIPSKRMFDALGNWAKKHNVWSRLGDSREFGRQLKAMAPSISKKTARLGDGEGSRIYELPSLTQLRDEWSAYIGHEEVWEDA